ncbi:MAG: cupin domain-containing protein, partial [Paracoccaceae bacterium]
RQHPDMPKVPLQPLTDETTYSHPVLGGGLGPYAWRQIGDAGGLTQFGAHLEVLPAGSRSSFRHWHEAEDEMIYMLAGEVVLIEDTESLLTVGDAACWPAGHPTGHSLENRSAEDAVYLVVGTRKQHDRIHYPDHDLTTDKDGPARRYSRPERGERPD